MHAHADAAALVDFFKARIGQLILWEGGSDEPQFPMVLILLLR